MEANQVLDVLKFIKGAYSRFEINEEMPRVWYEFLKDEKYETVIARLKKHISNSKFEPSIHDLVTQGDPELEYRKREIALNKWIQEGNNPDDFEFGHASNH